MVGRAGVWTWVEEHSSSKDTEISPPSRATEDGHRDRMCKGESVCVWGSDEASACGSVWESERDVKSRVERERRGVIAAGAAYDDRDVGVEPGRSLAQWQRL